MRQYKMNYKETKEIEKIICNSCGKEIQVVRGVPSEDVLNVQKRWGYASSKDNRRDEFDLCEACYDQMIHGFQIPPVMQED